MAVGRGIKESASFLCTSILSPGDGELTAQGKLMLINCSALGLALKIVIPVTAISY